MAATSKMPGHVKSSTKLPRGSYYYIKMGPMYYGGMKVEQTFIPPKKEPINAPFARYWNWQWQSSFVRRRPEKPAQGYTKTSTPQLMLVEDIKDAKQFRRRDQAERICEKLSKQYDGLEAKPTIILKD